MLFTNVMCFKCLFKKLFLWHFIARALFSWLERQNFNQILVFSVIPIWLAFLGKALSAYFPYQVAYQSLAMFIVDLISWSHLERNIFKLIVVFDATTYKCGTKLQRWLQSLLAFLE